MRINQLQTIHTWVRNARLSEILFVSALVLPIYMLLYNYALQEIQESWRVPGLAVALFLYIPGIAWMKWSQSKDEINKRDFTIIRNHILDQGFTFMSYEGLEKIPGDYDEARVRELVFAFPEELRFAMLKDKKPGIRVLNVD
jgi:hypothetical protein